MPKTKTESDVSAATTLPSFDRGYYPHWSGLEHGIQPGKFYDACLSSCCCLLFLDVSRYFIFTCSLTFFCRLCDTDGRREVEGNASVSQHVFWCLFRRHLALLITMHHYALVAHGGAVGELPLQMPSDKTIGGGDDAFNTFFSEISAVVPSTLSALSTPT